MYIPFFECWQKNILLRAVQALDLVDEEDTALPRELLAMHGLVHDFFHLGNGCNGRRHLNKAIRHAVRIRRRLFCDETRKGRFAGAGWAPQHHRRYLSALEEREQGTPHNRFLPYVLAQRAWAHALGKRTRRRHRVLTRTRVTRVATRRRVRWRVCLAFSGGCLLLW